MFFVHFCVIFFKHAKDSHGGGVGPRGARPPPSATANATAPPDEMDDAGHVLAFAGGGRVAKPKNARNRAKADFGAYRQKPAAILNGGRGYDSAAGGSASRGYYDGDHGELDDDGGPDGSGGGGGGGDGGGADRSAVGGSPVRLPPLGGPGGGDPVNELEEIVTIAISKVRSPLLCCCASSPLCAR